MIMIASHKIIGFFRTKYNRIMILLNGFIKLICEQILKYSVYTLLCINNVVNC